MQVEFAVEASSAVLAEAERKQLLTDPVFGRAFTDHMLTMHYDEELGWHDARIAARAPFVLDPACAALHYAQEIFEGMKAYRTRAGLTALFRPEAHATRFNGSARRLAMPEMPTEMFVAAVAAFVRTEQAWIPDGRGNALYLRPFMFASEAFVGVRPARKYIFAIIATPAGTPAVRAGGLRLLLAHESVRAARGGTGAAKCGGNYAAGLLAQAEAAKAGCDQILFLDAIEHRWIEELASTNIFFVMDDGTLRTPPLTGTILAGITRDSLITLATRLGHRVNQEPYDVAQLSLDAKNGTLRECFACGTAAVLSPVAEIKTSGGEIVFQSQSSSVTQGLREGLLDIYYGKGADPDQWLNAID